MQPNPNHQTQQSVTAGAIEPISVTVRQASALTGLAIRSIWRAIEDGRLDTIKPAGTRRTLVSFVSLKRLLAPGQALN